MTLIILLIHKLTFFPYCRLLSIISNPIIIFKNIPQLLMFKINKNLLLFNNNNKFYKQKLLYNKLSICILCLKYRRLAYNILLI